MTGEVCDEEILKKLGTVEGFKSLVHSIGISVEMEHSREPVTFVFQMYGKEDLYGGGTLIETELRGDGAEVRIPLDTVKWKQMMMCRGRSGLSLRRRNSLQGSMSVSF